MMKRIVSLALALLMLLGGLITATAESVKVPKYVFMFIGDGMGSPQITATEYFLGTQENPDAELPTRAPLSFTGFQNVGIMTTYDASSFCPDSASTATSMASGEKTLSGVINYDVKLEAPFKLITEYAKEAGKKVGVLTSVSADHASYAHTGIQIPVYATGAGAEAFAGSYDNTDIFTKTMNAMGLVRCPKQQARRFTAARLSHDSRSSSRQA